jgi:hypothetical protein
MTIPLAGCLLNGKPKTLAGAPAPPQTAAPAPPAEPLSIPQTHVDLPAPQPLNPDALATAQPVETPPPAQPKPAPPQKPAHTPAASSAKPSDPQTPAAEPEQPTRPQIQEILPPDEESRLRDSAHGHQAQAAALLAAAKPTTANQRRAEAEIRQFLKQSVEAETAGDMRLADQLAERANILAKELQSGK